MRVAQFTRPSFQSAKGFIVMQSVSRLFVIVGVVAFLSAAQTAIAQTAVAPATAASADNNAMGAPSVPSFTWGRW